MEPKLTLFSGEVQKPFSELPYDLKPGQFSYGAGGRGLRSGQWMITVLNGDVEEIYPLPDCLNHIINEAEICGKLDAQRAIKHALGL